MPQTLLCQTYASFAFACNSKHAFFVFHIFDQEEPNPGNLFYISISTISPVMCLHMSATKHFVRAYVYLRICVFHTQKIPVAVFPGVLQGEMQGEMQYLQVLQGCGHFLASSFLALVVLPFVCLQRDQEEG